MIEILARDCHSSDKKHLCLRVNLNSLQRLSTGLLGILLAKTLLCGGIGSCHEMEEEAKRLLEKRTEMVANLTKVVRQKAGDAAQLMLQKKAIEILGDLKDSKATPVLIEFIDDYFDALMEVVDHDDIGNVPETPAMKALAKLDALAIEPLIKAYLGTEEPIRLRRIHQSLTLLPSKELAANAVWGQWFGEKSPRPKKKLGELFIWLTGRDPKTGEK